MTSSKSYKWIGILLLLSGHGFALEASDSIDIEVTASPLAIESNSSAKIYEISAPAETYIVNELGLASGVQIQRYGGPGHSAGILLRGARPQHAAILYNGSLLNDPSTLSGSFDFQSQMFGAGVKTEILYGPQSVRFGSGALAGAVVMTSNNSQLNNEMSVFAGSLKSLGGSAEAHQNDYKKFQPSIGLQYREAPQFSAAHEKYGNKEFDKSEALNAQLRVHSELTENQQITWTNLYRDTETALDRNGGPNADDPNYDSFSDEIFSQLNYQLFQEKFLHNLSLSYHRSLRDEENLADKLNSDSLESKYLGERLSLKWESLWTLNEEYLLRFGADTRQEAGEFFNENSTGFGEADFSKSDSSYGGFIQLAREKNNWRYLTGFRSALHSNAGAHNVGEVEVDYNWNSANKTSWRLAQGYKDPSLFQIYDPTYGDKTLKPEEVVGGFLAHGIAMGSSEIKNTLFANNYQNLITGDASDGFRNKNIESIQNRGYEIAFRQSTLLGLVWQIDYTYNHFYDTSTNRQLLRRAFNQLGLKIENSWTQYLDSTLQLNYVGARRDTDPEDFSTRHNPEYYVLNISGTYRWRENTHFFTRWENLFNADYEEVLGFGTQPLTLLFGIRSLL